MSLGFYRHLQYCLVMTVFLILLWFVKRPIKYFTRVSFKVRVEKIAMLTKLSLQVWQSLCGDCQFKMTFAMNSCLLSFKAFAAIAPRLCMI